MTILFFQNRYKDILNRKEAQFDLTSLNIMNFRNRSAIIEFIISCDVQALMQLLGTRTFSELKNRTRSDVSNCKTVNNQQQPKEQHHD